MGENFEEDLHRSTLAFRVRDAPMAVATPRRARHGTILDPHKTIFS